MEERKLIRLGNSSFAIALPKNWVDKSGLKKGDKVYIVPNSNGEIIVSPEFKKINGGGKEVELNIEGKDEGKIRREFTSAYINGNSTFKFFGDVTQEKRRMIKKIVKDYIGCEVTEENGKEIIAQDFFDFEEINIENFIRRIDNNIRDMFNMIIKAIEENKISKKDLEEIYSIDLDVNKFYFLNSRIMNAGFNNPAVTAKLKKGASDLFNNWWISFHLEHTGDNLKSIGRKINSAHLDSKTKKELLLIIEKLKEKYEASLKSFYSFDEQEVCNLMESGKEIWGMCEKLTQHKNPFISWVGEKLKNVENSSYQILKMMSQIKG